jgi:O-antigen/teichoic acid export membrane protein
MAIPPRLTAGAGVADVAMGAELQPEQAVAAVGPSLARSSSVKLLADGASLVFGMIAAVLTARWLGPSGKGLLASLFFLAGLIMQLCSIGIGDAAIVFVGHRRVDLQRAAGVTVAVAIGMGLVGAGLLLGAARIAFRADWPAVRAAVLVASVGMPVTLLAYVLTFLLSAQERIAASSAVLATTSGLTTVGIGIFVGVAQWSVKGGVIGSLFGGVAGLVLAIALLARSGLSLRPGWDSAYARLAVRYGLTIEASYLVTVLFMRVDLLLTYALAGSAPAGRYSVALTVSGLAGLAPTAIAYAAFPRLANLDESEAAELTARLSRLSLAAAGVSTVALLVVAPLLIPLLFGRAFRSAAGPTLILLPGSILWSGQWLVCRAAAARGRPGLLLRSFGLGLAVMCTGDFILIPRIGINGGAISALIGPMAGLALALVSYARAPWWPMSVWTLFPRPGDLAELWRHGRSALGIAPPRVDR